MVTCWASLRRRPSWLRSDVGCSRNSAWACDGLVVLITPGSPRRNDLLRDGRDALQAFPQPKPGSDEFYIAGQARLIDDAAETAFELMRERVRHTRWEHVLTPPMRAVHQSWRAPGS